MFNTPSYKNNKRKEIKPRAISFLRKLWKDGVSEYPSRRLLVNVDSGEQTLVNVEKSVGMVSQEGDPWNAENMNGLEGRIEEGFNSVKTEMQTSLTSLENRTKAYTDSAKTGAVATSKNYTDYEIARYNNNISRLLNLQWTRMTHLWYRCPFPEDPTNGQLFEFLVKVNFDDGREGTCGGFISNRSGINYEYPTGDSVVMVRIKDGYLNVDATGPSVSSIEKPSVYGYFKLEPITPI